MEDLRTECGRLTLLDNALALQYKELKENAKAITFNVGVTEKFLGKHKSKKT